MYEQDLIILFEKAIGEAERVIKEAKVAILDMVSCLVA